MRMVNQSSQILRSCDEKKGEEEGGVREVEWSRTFSIDFGPRR